MAGPSLAPLLDEQALSSGEAPRHSSRFVAQRPRPRNSESFPGSANPRARAQSAATGTSSTGATSDGVVSSIGRSAPVQLADGLVDGVYGYIAAGLNWEGAY